MSRIEIAVKLALADFELDVELASDAPALAVFGPSGAGKTTLLELVTGWRTPRVGRIAMAGSVLFDSTRGIDLSPAERHIGYVPQDVLLFPHWTVLRNVTAGATRRRRALDANRVERALDVLELRALGSRAVDTLSGGERRRVALARALCSHPALLVLDEPLGALDEALRQRILPYLLRLRREFDVPIVYVSHDATEVQALCDEVVVLERGRAHTRGRPSEVFARASGSRDFENVLSGRVVSYSGDTARVELAPEVELVIPRGELAPPMQCLVGLSARDLLLASQRPVGLSARNVLAGTVAELTPAGKEVGVDVELGPAVRLRANVTHAAVAELGLAPGARVFVVAKTHSCRLIASWDAGPV